MMNIEPHENVPLSVDRESGTIRVEGGRLKLDNVIICYEMGHSTPEALHAQYDFISVDTMRRILDWYHIRKDEVDAYVAHNEAMWEEARGYWEPISAEREERARRQHESAAS